MMDRWDAPPSELSSPSESAEVTERPKSTLREYFESAVVTVIMALFGMTFVVQAVKVPTGSMQNNILIGDHLLVNKFLFAERREGIFWRLFPYREVRRGDVVVFKYPQNPEVNYVKRVVGLPGETIEIRGTRVFINGRELPEQRLYVQNPRFDAEDSALQIVREEPPPEGAQYRVYWESYHAEREDAEFPSGGRYAVGRPFFIPERAYFVMGDNRDDSEDSRFWGTVPREYVVGRALVVYWSYDERAAAAHGGNLLLRILRHARWKRVGTLIR
ncbi:MAG: signal peptidase I [Blastocatellia bacterium]|nr:signal peptidase I [Blastocatellia bacterium]MCS7157408.1 signal peptidase I [Blastocatellia bacterium]MCX7752582.1 signal peptidase I [Blastocatellia bacterium]MDW8168313.1 signal peptidase I [Acidobacteriota bacterium]MDW8255509.1 signal peptidase I [Acidobacteriota bacterium]